MKLTRSDEQVQLAKSLRAFLARTAPTQHVRSVADTPHSWDRTTWQRLGNELGVLGISVPERLGGAGFGIGELCVVAEELGAALTAVPFLSSSVLTAHCLLELDDDALNKTWLPPLAGGERIGALVADLTGGPTPIRGRPSVEGVLLDGDSGPLLGVVEATHFLVVAAFDQGERVIAVEGDSPGLRRVRMSTIDPTRPVARLEFRRVPGRPVGGPDPAAALERALDVVRVVLAAEQLGGMRACLDSVVAYVKVRVQFGRIVGSFQGVKHRLADMRVALEEAESIVRYAAWAADSAPEERSVAAALAQVRLSTGYFSLAKQHLLLFGGIGFTWEHDAHLYYKRAKSDELLLGAPGRARSLLADRLGLL